MFFTLLNSRLSFWRWMNFMSFILRLYAYVYIYDYFKRKKKKKERLEKEKGVRGNKGIKGVRDTFREINERMR